MMLLKKILNYECFFTNYANVSMMFVKQPWLHRLFEFLDATLWVAFSRFRILTKGRSPKLI